jgi:hypothetical protein
MSSDDRPGVSHYADNDSFMRRADMVIGLGLEQRRRQTGTIAQGNVPADELVRSGDRSEGVPLRQTRPRVCAEAKNKPSHTSLHEYRGSKSGNGFRSF